MIGYEIHICRDGVWKIDSVFDDRELALHEARRAESTGRYAGIRVVEEIYSETTRTTSARVIFRTSRSAREAKARRAATAGRTVATRPAGGGRERTAKPKPHGQTGKAEDRPLLMALLVLLVFATGFAGLVVLSQLAE